MKKITVITLIIFSLLLTGCSNKNETTNSATANNYQEKNNSEVSATVPSCH